MYDLCYNIIKDIKFCESIHSERTFMDIRHIFVINPAAGKGKEAQTIGDKIGDACRGAGVDFEVYYTKCPRDGTRFVKERLAAKEAGKTYRFYACGGDGTLSEIVCGTVDESLGAPIPEVEVGCIPIGTGNDFVRNFTNSEFFSDITKQILADARVIDCYRFDEGRYGLNMINIGFDCEAAARMARYKKKPFIPKGFAYIAGVAVELIKNKGKLIKVTFEDGRSVEKVFQLASAANGAFCGGGFRSAPRTSLSDGLLDVSLIDKVTRRQFISIVGSYKKGTHLETALGKRIVDYSKARSVLFEFSEQTNVCIDGEIEPMDRLQLTVVHEALSFVFPIGCEIK